MKKAIDTASLIVQTFGLLKSIAIALAMATMEYLRIKAVKAKDGQAHAETQLKIKEAHENVDKENADKSPRGIIDEFINDSPKPGEGD